MAPGSTFIILIFQHLVISVAFLLCFYFTLHLYHKNTKNIILSYLSDRALVGDRVGLTTPYRVGCEELFALCRYEGLARGLLLD